jgi:hypothetical protein
MYKRAEKALQKSRSERKAEEEEAARAVSEQEHARIVRGALVETTRKTRRARNAGLSKRLLASASLPRGLERVDLLVTNKDIRQIRSIVLGFLEPPGREALEVRKAVSGTSSLVAAVDLTELGAGELHEIALGDTKAGSLPPWSWVYVLKDAGTSGVISLYGKVSG